MGTVFVFSTTVQPSEPGREAKLIAYERMLASMKIDPCYSTRRLGGGSYLPGTPTPAHSAPPLLRSMGGQKIA